MSEETTTAPTDVGTMVDYLLEPEAPSEDKPEAEKAEVTAVTTDTSKSDGAVESLEEEALEEDVEESEDEEVETEEDEDSEEETEDTEGEEPEEEEGSEEEEPSPTVFEVDGDAVTLEDLKSGYLRQADYTKKTQQLSSARAGLEQYAEGIKAHEETVAEHLSLALQVLEPQLQELASIDMDALAREDAYEYAEKRALMDQAQARYGKLREAADGMVAQRKQQAQAQFEQHRTAEGQKLLMALPDMADPKLGRNLAHSIKEYAVSTVGLSPEEAGNIVDHRLVVALNKARQFDEMTEAGLKIAKQKVKKGPSKVISSGKPRSKTQKQAETQKTAREKLRASGSTDDAVDFLLSG